MAVQEGAVSLEVNVCVAYAATMQSYLNVLPYADLLRIPSTHKNGTQCPTNMTS